MLSFLLSPRFLIKHLPKQLSKLRNDKADLEEKIEDLEQRIGQQAVALQEMERRNEVYRKELEISKSKNSNEPTTTAAAASNDRRRILEVPMVASEAGTELSVKFLAAPKVRYRKYRAGIFGTKIG